MGFRDYYRQFEDLDPDELNRALRVRRHEERRRALERIPDLDLSGTEWPDLPDSEIVNAAIARARGRVNGYPDRHASGVRRLLAERHGVAPEQIVLGNGAAELLQSAAMALLARGDELLMPWPSYPLYPLMAAHAYAQPVAVDPAALLDSVTPRTRALVICNPNDPTGEHLTGNELGNLIAALPEEVPRPAGRGARPLPGRRAARRLPAPGGRVPPAAGGADLLEDLRPVRPARRLRDLLRRQAAGRDRARARGQRPQPGRRGARAAHRRRARSSAAEGPFRASASGCSPGCASWASTPPRRRATSPGWPRPG